MVDLSRRHFIKILGIGSLAFAPGCNSRPEKNLFSYDQAPEDMVTGKPTWYASTCRECPAGCGILAKNRESRVIKVEGNPLHPINQGKLCMRGQAALQGVYNPDRIRRPLLKKKDGWQALSFQEAEACLKEKIDEAVRKGENRVHMLTEVVGRSLSTLFEDALRKWSSPPPLAFEPFAYESLKAANQKVFGLNGLPSYRMEEADFLLCFGADFLETWLSPVEYGRKFKQMHAVNQGRKGFFVHVSPYQSLTCANADLWLSCTPGSEIVIGLGLTREALQGDRRNDLPADLRSALQEISSPFTKERVTELSGVDPDLYASLAARIRQARKPLILGTGTGAIGPTGLQVNMVANLLNGLLDAELALLDFNRRHAVEKTARRSEVTALFEKLRAAPEGVLLLNNVNPAFALPASGGAAEVLKQDGLFTVSFSNFMDETTQLANLIFPVRLPLETWDEYSGTLDIVAMVQPTMAGLTGAPHLGDLFLRLAYGDQSPAKSFQEYLSIRLSASGFIKDRMDWVNMLRKGGLFERNPSAKPSPRWISGDETSRTLGSALMPKKADLTLYAAPSIRFFDGRGANRPWLCEVPDPLTKVAWQSPVWVNPQTLKQHGLKQGDVLELKSQWGTVEAPVYETEGVRPGVLLMSLGQGHEEFGRYAEGMGTNPVKILPPQTEPVSGSPLFAVSLNSIRFTGRSLGSAQTEGNKGFPAQFGIYYRQKFAHTDGSKVQHGRKIALSVNLHDPGKDGKVKKEGYGMWEFPLVLPLPEGYDKKRDIYPPHEHEKYRWAMVVDLDRCVGCNACAAACYAENNVGIAGPDRMREGREMAWLSIERYLDEETMKKVTFLPMLCQHCDNAPCESVCPVFAPNHSKEGLNNQIFNRCIGTRFCSQNCPYKVRRFNWFDWKWPEPLHLQLNPDVTVRSKGVMEKCSFCVQRIKDAHGVAKDEKREIRDGEVQPACVQTCPTRALIFGNLMDHDSLVRRLTADPRAYQVMGYLNTKPAVIYLKKVAQEI
jgi:anaerobic selenocysteine-containing dehydrogenase/Fe-S-cluster-containing dehydrogenase component